MACAGLAPGQNAGDRDILPGIEKRQKIVGLEDEADLLQPQTAQVGAQPFAVIDQFAVEPHAPGIRFENAADHIEQRALARSAGPAQADHGSGKDIERNLAQRIDAGRPLAEMLADPSDFDDRLLGHGYPASAEAGSILSAVRTPSALASRQATSTTPNRIAASAGSRTTRRGK